MTPETASTSWRSTICCAQALRMSSVSRSLSPKEAICAEETLPFSTEMNIQMELKSVFFSTT